MVNFDPSVYCYLGLNEISDKKKEVKRMLSQDGGKLHK